jgi:transcriptional regulator with XRE-family HTH domain
METDKDAFGRALQAARTNLGWSQEYLAQLLDGSQAAIASWERGMHAPDPQVVFLVERKLGARPGELSQYLGYIPNDAAGANGARAKADTVEAILRDPRLSEADRKAMLGLYRSLVR